MNREDIMTFFRTDDSLREFSQYDLEEIIIACCQYSDELEIKILKLLAESLHRIDERKGTE